MTWSNPPAIVTQWREQIIACATVSGAGIVSARAHYPAIALQTDTLPAVVVSETDSTRDLFAEGVGGIPSGTLVATFYLPASSFANAGMVESFGRAVEKELMEQARVIPFRSIQSGLSSDPEPGAKAAGGNLAHYVIKLTATYGLRAG